MTILEGKALLDHSKAIARRHLGRVDEATADDLGAEAVLRALRSPAPDGRMQPWLERIFRNLFVDLWRRRQPAMAMEDVSPFAATDTPEEQLLLRERRQAVRTMLAQLPRQARRALLARYYGELGAEEGAARLGIEPATYRTRVHRSLRRLRDLLGDLRAWFPPGLFKLVGAKSSALAMVPVAVAMLAVVEFHPQTPVPESTETETVIHPSEHRTALPVVQVAMPESVARVAAENKPRPRIAKVALTNPAEIAPPAVQVIAVAKNDQVVGDIQAPEEIFVVGSPPKPSQPSLIEIPTSFAAQFEKMVEDGM
jgi:RNA polymerase sigma factor (sigma-70 family)